jgi:hypothetical protein
VRSGRRMLKPEMKYSATNMDPRRAKQKPSSIHIEVNTSGLSRPSRSISDALYDPRECGGLSSSFAGAPIGTEVGAKDSMRGDSLIVVYLDSYQAP